MHLEVCKRPLNSLKLPMTNILKKLTEFAEKQAERRNVDKQVFVWAVICFCDFIRKNDYEIIYKGKQHDKQNIRTSKQPGESDAIL